MTTDQTTKVLGEALTSSAREDDDLLLARVRARLEQVMVDGPIRQRRPTSRRRPVLVAVAVLLAAMVAVGVAAAAGVIEVPGLRHHAAEQVTGLTAPEGVKPSAEESRMIKWMVSEITTAPRAPGVDYGPVDDDFPSYDDARLLLDDGGMRVTALGSGRGDVCAVYFIDESMVTGTCFSEFERRYGITSTDGGVTSGSTRISSYLFGLAKSDVDSIEIVDKDGSRTNASVEGGAWAWRGGLGAHAITIIIHRSDGTEVRRPVVARADFEN